MSMQDKLNLWFTKLFNDHATMDGTPPYTYYADSFDRSDYGVAIRIEDGLAIQTQNLELFMLVPTTVLLLVGITIIWKQRKIYKELKQLRQLLDQKEDKPE